MIKQLLPAATILAFLAICVSSARAGDPYPPDPPLPASTLPEPLRTRACTRGTTADQWKSARRNEVLELFRTNVYGRVPTTSYEKTFHVTHEDAQALGGAATLRQVEIRI